MHYLLLLKSDEHPELGPPPAELMAAIAEHGAAMAQAGVLISTAGLAPAPMGRRLRLEDGRTTPVPAREQIDAYALIKAAGDDEAADLAGQFLALHAKHWPGWQGEAEVRALFGAEGA
ncbi:YciI family protein [Nonomuraea sp. NPDC050328]|uniref:YciI family protein n=1 Tax=Nonomuraea sp. NPDC050328 TaxID=3364361 RepID=UPI003789B8E5